MNRLIVFALVILSIFVSSVAGAELQVTVLDNGLTVVTQELHYSPVVVSAISYRVGSRNETGDDLGLSHFMEHQMFKGTPDMPKGRFWQIVQRDGGTANAFTSSDCTCYYLVLPTSRLEDALAIESDRMINCLVDSAEVVSERNVVHEERRARSIDSPDGALREALAEIAYTEHPYGLPVIGYDENILAYNPVSTRAYYETYYCPSNAVLTFVGDFDTDDLLKQIDAYFGDIPAGNVPLENIPVEPRQTEARFVEIEHASNLPRFTMAFHSCSGDAPAAPAMAMMSSYLSGRTGKLNELLVESKLIYGIGAWDESGIDPGMFYIAATMNPADTDGITIEEIQEMIWDELDELSTNGISVEILEDLKNRDRAREILSNANPTGLAINYSLSTTMFDNPLHGQEQLDLIEQLTPDDIKEAASACFRRNGVNIAVLNPAGSNGGGGESHGLPTDITEPSSVNYDGLEISDEFLVPPTTSIAEGVQTYELPNGLVLLIKEDHTFPTVTINFSVPMGTLRHSSELNGLCGVTTSTMMNGTEELEYIDFHKRLTNEGAYLRFHPGWKNSSGSITLLSEDLKLGFSALADLLLNPAFRKTDFDKIIAEKHTALAASAERIDNIAYRNLMAITANTSADYKMTSTESIDRITLDEVINHYEQCCRPNGSVITVVGDINPETILHMTEDYFSEWSNPDEPLPELQISQFTSCPGDTAVEFMEGRVQGAIMIATQAPGRDMPDYPAFNTMNTILGKGIGSRLGHSVRDEQGLAYQIGSWASAMDSTGIFTAELTTLADYVPQATISVIAEMEKIATENVKDIELLLVQANSAGKQALSSMSYGGLASRLTALQAEGRPLDYHLTYLSMVLALTPDDLREAAAKYFIPNEWFISIAGSLTEEDVFSQ